MNVKFIKSRLTEAFGRSKYFNANYSMAELEHWIISITDLRMNDVQAYREVSLLPASVVAKFLHASLTRIEELERTRPRRDHRLQYSIHNIRQNNPDVDRFIVVNADGDLVQDITIDTHDHIGDTLTELREAGWRFAKPRITIDPKDGTEPDFNGGAVLPFDPTDLDD